MIHVVFVSDDTYAQHVGVAITSLKDQQRLGKSVHVHLLDGGISVVNLQRLNSLRGEHVTITVYKANMEEYADYLVLEHFSRAMYLRLSIEEVLPKNVTKVIYFDSDIIFLGPIDDLWNVDLSGSLMAAVGDYGTPFNYLRKDLGIDKPGEYFNSGVMVINLEAWRINQVCRKVKTYICSNRQKLYYPDQDGLNAVLHGNWLRLDTGWNRFSGTVRDRDMSNRPAVVHFASAFKPWFYKNVDVYQEDYLRYLRQTPWKEYQFPDKNFINWLRRKVILKGPRFLFYSIQFFTVLWRRLMLWCARQKALMKMKV